MALESNNGLGIPVLGESLLLLDVAGKNSTAIFMEPLSTAPEGSPNQNPQRKICENLRKIACQAPEPLNAFIINNISVAY
jgi:hypothetical protein